MAAGYCPKLPGCPRTRTPSLQLGPTCSQHGARTGLSSSPTKKSSALRDALKNSLAHLRPLQLLARLPRAEKQPRTSENSITFTAPMPAPDRGKVTQLGHVVSLSQHVFDRPR